LLAGFNNHHSTSLVCWCAGVWYQGDAPPGFAILKVTHIIPSQLPKFKIIFMNAEVPVNNIQRLAMLHMNQYTTNGLRKLAGSRVNQYHREGSQYCESEALRKAEIRHGSPNELVTTEVLSVVGMRMEEQQART
jgi:hypothetical protein